MNTEESQTGKNPSTETVDAATANKRAAMAGQWRTPPLPNFPAGPSSKGGVSGALQVSSLPGTTEDYAKALREAYMRGAEAAAKMKAGEAEAVASNAASAAAVQPTSVENTATTHPGFYVQQQVQPQAAVTPTAPATVPNPLIVSPQPAIAPPVAVLPSSNPPLAPAAPVSGVVPMATTSMPVAPPPQQHQAVVVNPTTAAATTQRSMSLPDMASYAAKQEEDKRQKRLARNRASARLRRLRKKNLVGFKSKRGRCRWLLSKISLTICGPQVDAYETEVGILEKTLSALNAHEWGAQDNASALTDALSMDRGQQVLDAAQRKQSARDILQQQLQVVDMLQDLLSEQYVLFSLQDSNEFDDLKETLQLTESQLQQLASSKAGWREEWDALQTIKASLTAMRDNDWLWNEGVTQVAEDFMNILHANQISKFLLWTDHNAEAIDELDMVNAGSVNGPVFAFGTEQGGGPGNAGGGEE